MHRKRFIKVYIDHNFVRKRADMKSVPKYIICAQNGEPNRHYNIVRVAVSTKVKGVSGELTEPGNVRKRMIFPRTPTQRHRRNKILNLPNKNVCVKNSTIFFFHASPTCTRDSIVGCSFSGRSDTLKKLREKKTPKVSQDASSIGR